VFTIRWGRIARCGTALPTRRRRRSRLRGEQQTAFRRRGEYRRRFRPFASSPLWTPTPDSLAVNSWLSPPSRARR